MGLALGAQGLQGLLGLGDARGELFILSLKPGNGVEPCLGVAAQLLPELLQLPDALLHGGALALQPGKAGGDPGRFLADGGKGDLQAALAPGLGLALRAQGGGGPLQGLDALLGLDGVGAVALHALAHLGAVGKELAAAALQSVKAGAGAAQALGELQDRVLRLAQLRPGGIQLIPGGGELPLGVVCGGLGGLQVGIQGLALRVQPLELVCPGENAGAFGHGAAGHGAAGIEYLAVQGDDAEAVTKLPGHGHGVVDVPGDDHPAQKVGENVPVLPVKLDKGVAHAHKAGLTLHRRILELGGTDGVHRQEGGPAAVPALEEADGVLAVLVPLHHDVLHGAAQGDLDGRSVLVGDADEPGHRPPDALEGAPIHLTHQQLYRLGVALVELFHFGEHPDAGGKGVFLHLEPALAFFRVGGALFPGLAANLVAADDVFDGIPLLRGLGKLLLKGVSAGTCLPDAPVLPGELLAQALVPVEELLGGGGQGGEQLPGLQGGGAAQPLPLPQGGELFVEGAHALQQLLGARLQCGKLVPGGAHIRLKALQTIPALRNLVGKGAGAALLLLQLAAQALGVLGVILDVVAQQGDGILVLAGGAIRCAQGLPQALRLQILLLHFAGAGLLGGVELVPLALCAGKVGLGGLKVGVELGAARAQPLELIEPQRHLQRPEFVAQKQEFLCFLRLDAQGLHLELQLVDLVVDAHQVFLRALQLALCLLLAVAEAGDAGGLLKNLPAVGALGGQYLVDAALADDGVALPAKAGVHEQLVDVLEAAGAAVDVVFTLAGAVIPPGDGYLALLQRENMLGVVQHQRDLCKAQPLAPGGAVKDDVLHFAAPEGAGGLLAHDPADGVCNVGFSRAVGADDGGDVLAERKDGFIREGFEPLDF